MAVVDPFAAWRARALAASSGPRAPPPLHDASLPLQDGALPSSSSLPPLTADSTADVANPALDGASGGDVALARVLWSATLSATEGEPRPSPIPSFVREALTDPNRRRAMEEEYEALLANQTWDLVPCLYGRNVLTGKWIWTHKCRADTLVRTMMRHSV
jgi:histone deacetylase 1/2